jgi:hypothetical protein
MKASLMEGVSGQAYPTDQLCRIGCTRLKCLHQLCFVLHSLHSTLHAYPTDQMLPNNMKLGP